MAQVVSIDLMINGKSEHIEEKFVPFRKHIEMLEMNAEVVEGNTTDLEWKLKKTEFIASLFSDERVTKESVLDGLSADNADEVMEMIIAEMLGYDPNSIAEVPTA